MSTRVFPRGLSRVRGPIWLTVEELPLNTLYTNQYLVISFSIYVVITRG